MGAPDLQPGDDQDIRDALDGPMPHVTEMPVQKIEGDPEAGMSAIEKLGRMLTTPEQRANADAFMAQPKRPSLTDPQVAADAAIGVLGGMDAHLDQRIPFGVGDAIRERRDEASKRNPELATGADVVGTMLSPIGVEGESAKLGAVVARQAATGAMQGAGHAIGDSTSDEDLKTQAWKALAGAAAGGGAGAALGGVVGGTGYLLGEAADKARTAALGASGADLVKLAKSRGLDFVEGGNVGKMAEELGVTNRLLPVSPSGYADRLGARAARANEEITGSLADAQHELTSTPRIEDSYSHMREGMRPLDVHLGGYEGASPDEVDVIASGRSPTKNSASPFDPIKIRDGELVDGRHRVAAARIAGAKNIAANVDGADTLLPMGGSPIDGAKQRVLDELRHGALDPAEGDIGQEAGANSARDAVASDMERRPMQTLEDMRSLKTSLDKSAFKNGSLQDSSASMMGQAQRAGGDAVRNELRDLVAQASPDTNARYTQGNLDYGKASLLGELAKKRAAQQYAGGGMLGNLAGGAIGGSIGYAFGGPATAAAGAGLGMVRPALAAAQHYGPDLGANLGRLGESALTGVGDSPAIAKLGGALAAKESHASAQDLSDESRGQLIPEAIQAALRSNQLGPYSQQFAKAAMSPDANALGGLYSVLSQTDPKFAPYQRMLQQMTAEGDR